MFSIGDFAALGRVSPRMLRHYDAIGLLRPAVTDPATGYRHYQADQLRRLNRVIALKDLGLSLAQIADVIDDKVGVVVTDLIRRKIVDLRDQKDTATLLFSADLNELINVSDSIIVLYEGKIVAYFEDLTGITPEVLGEYMLGVKKQDDAVIGGVVHE